MESIKEKSVRDMITDLLHKKTELSDIEPNQDFFDLGASSLTIVDLQLQVEEVLGVSVETKHLMTNPTIDGWVDLYESSI